MRIYVASSWRNLYQPAIVVALRSIGHEVYDFRAPAPGNNGFSWSEIDPNWQSWTTEQYRVALEHPIALKGYAHDITALRECEACVLVLPAGRSASWEFGYAMGQGKPGYVVQLERQEPELMFRESTILASMGELFDTFGEPREPDRESPLHPGMESDAEQCSRCGEADAAVDVGPLRWCQRCFDDACDEAADVYGLRVAVTRKHREAAWLAIYPEHSRLLETRGGEMVGDWFDNGGADAAVASIPNRVALALATIEHNAKRELATGTELVVVIPFEQRSELL